MTSHHEDAEQKAVFQWAAHHAELKWMHAVPNGGNRNPREAARLVGQGVKPGVSDIFLPLARGGHHGLYIEMKRQKKHGPSRVSKDQASFQYAMIDEGYQAVVCYGAGEAITAIKNYCGL